MNDDQEKQELRDMVAALTKQVATLIGTMTPIPSRYTFIHGWTNGYGHIRRMKSSRPVCTNYGTVLTSI